MNALKFQAPKLKEQAIEIGDQAFTLREMTGTARDAYNTFVSTITRFDMSGKPVGFRTFEGMQSTLIEKCLFDASGQPVPRKTIDLWPASLVEALYEACRKLNGMLTNEEKKEDAEKNEPQESSSAGSGLPPS